MATVFLLVGPIASGKSTFARKLAEKGAVVINDDAITTVLSGGLYRWQEQHKPIYKTTEMHILQSALALGLDVVIDKPNFSRATRMRWIGMAKAMDAAVVVYRFRDNGYLVHAERRFKCDSRGKTLTEWQNAAKRHQHCADVLEESEGYDELREAP